MNQRLHRTLQLRGTLGVLLEGGYRTVELVTESLQLRAGHTRPASAPALHLSHKPVERELVRRAQLHPGTLDAEFQSQPLHQCAHGMLSLTRDVDQLTDTRHRRTLCFRTGRWDRHRLHVERLQPEDFVLSVHGRAP